MAKQSPTELIQAVDRTISQVRTRSLDVSFNELFDMHKAAELIIKPDFQRLFRWSDTKQSQFIESLILELPVPPIYVIEVDDGVYELIDGLQRISSYFHFRGFLAGEKAEDFLRLQDCDVLTEFNGLNYNELPSAIQIKLKRHFIRMEVLRKESDKRLRYHMFKRLNTGGELLSPQEIRNCTIRLLDNTFNEFLKKMARDQHFITCMTLLSDDKKEQMYMEEFALRFFAFKNYSAHYRKDVEDFLTSYMEAVSDEEVREVKFDYKKEQQVFQDTFRVLAEALAESVFSGLNRQGNPQGYFSSNLFDALTIGVQPSLQQLMKAKPNEGQKFRDAVLTLKRDPEFERVTKGGGKNYAAAMRQRFKIAEQRIAECLN